MTKPDDLRGALYRVIGSLTDERVDAVLRAEAIPLHGKALSDDLRARYVAATLRAHLKEGIDAALAAASGAERPIDEERLAEALLAVTNDSLYSGDKGGAKWRRKTAAQLIAAYNAIPATDAEREQS